MGEHADEVKQGIDKAGDFVAGKFGQARPGPRASRARSAGLVDKIAAERGADPPRS